MNPQDLTDQDRTRIARRLQFEQRARFGGSKKAAYTAAGVNPATWDRALTGRRIRDDRLTAIIAKLWPSSEGDWSEVPNELAPRVAAGEVPGIEERLKDIERRLTALETERGEGRVDAGPAATKMPEVGPADQPTKDDVTLAAAEGDRDPRDEAEETMRST